MGWLSHLLFPQESNNYRARLLHPGSLSLVVTLFLVFQFGLNFFALVSPSVLGYAANITPERIIELTNQERMDQGLGSLVVSATLSEAAQRKAADMFAFNYWAHNSPSGRSPWSFFKEVDYRYLYAGENLARDFADSEGVVRAWMASATHKDNILNRKYQEIGIAVVNGTLQGVETTLVVELFGTPTPMAPAPQSPPGVVKEAVALAQEPAISQEAAFVFEKMIEVPQVVLANPFSLTKTLAVFILGFLAGVILVEAVIVRHRKVARLSGRSLAHTAFLGAIILMIIMMRQGAIL